MRRLAPLPCVSRNSASSSKEVFIIFSSYITHTASRHRDQLPGRRPTYSARSVDIERTDRFLVADAANRFGQQSRHAQLPDLIAFPTRIGQRNRVGDDHFVQNRF